MKEFVKTISPPLVILGMLLVLANAALALEMSMDVKCLDREIGENILRNKYRELPVSTGKILSANNVEDHIILWANSATGTWTMSRTINGGLMCFIAAGKNFEDLLGEPL